MTLTPVVLSLPRGYRWLPTVELGRDVWHVQQWRRDDSWDAACGGPAVADVLQLPPAEAFYCGACLRRWLSRGWPR